ncbi:MAG: 30S ribosomal protein S24e [Zestosphaera sp.]
MSQAPLKTVSVEEGVVVNVLRENHNKVVGRVELFGEVIHLGKATPRRSSLKSVLARLYGRSPELVVVKYIKSEYGSHRSRFEANIYDAIERLKFFEPEYLVRRGAE